MVFLSNLGWQISVWSTSCYCSSSWWWWWLLLWDLLERCKEVFFSPLRFIWRWAPGFGGRIFVGERYYTLDPSAPSLCGRQRPSGVLINSGQKYTVRFPHRGFLVASSFTRSRSFPSCSRPLEQLEIAVPCGKMFDLLMFCVAHCWT